MENSAAGFRRITGCKRIPVLPKLIVQFSTSAPILAKHVACRVFIVYFFVAIKNSVPIIITSCIK